MKPIGNYTAEARAPFLRFKCPSCGARPRVACQSASGTEGLPHKTRVLRARQARTA